MKIQSILQPLKSLNTTRKLAKPLVVGISMMLVVSMLSMLASISVEGSAMPSALHVDGRHIKDSAGNIIYLRGLQKVELADDPDGTWMGNPYWTDANVRAELAVMKSWGANTVRCIQSIDNWKFNLGPGSGYSSITNQDAVKRLLTLAGEQGMYVIFTGYRVTNWFNGGNQDPLPYPPYQTSQGASSVISSKQEFINWWADVANQLKGYPNVLFEIWNEPMGPRAEHLVVQQQVIDAIRATGARNLILTQWDMGTWANLDFPPPHNDASTMDWITQANFKDPLNNIVYVTHIYRNYGHTGLYSNPSSLSRWGTDKAYDYNEIKRALQYTKVDWVLNTVNAPVFVTETGFNNDRSGNEANYEAIAYENLLKIFHEWGIHYIVHWFREIGIYRLHTGAPNFTPTRGGQITRTFLQASQQSNPTPVPNPTQTPTPAPTNTPTPNPTQTPTPAPTQSPPLTQPNPTPTQTPEPSNSPSPQSPWEPIRYFRQYVWRIFWWPGSNWWFFNIRF
jgi:hypothetical protein